MATALELINARVKKLKKLHPKSARVELQRKASAQLRKEGKIGKPKKVSGILSKIKKAVSKGPKRKPVYISKNQERALDKRYPTKIASAKVKKSAPAKKITIKVKRSKSGNTRLSIGSVSISKIQTEMKHLQGLESSLMRYKELHRQKGLTPSEKASLKRDIAKTQNAIRACKQHISALKRSI